VLEDLWSKYQINTKTFLSEKEVARAMIRDDSSGQLARLVVEAKQQAVASTSSDAANSVLTTAVTNIAENQSLNFTEKARLQEYIRGEVSTNYGTVSEQRTAVVAQQQVSSVGSSIREVQQFFDLPIWTSASFQYVLRGRPDRVEIGSDGSTTLVEIKNRMRKLFKGNVTCLYCRRLTHPISS
jgi:hypothetical protein